MKKNGKSKQKRKEKRWRTFSIFKKSSVSRTTRVFKCRKKYYFIKKLIDFIIKTDEIRKHQERLKKKKVFDKLEQKKVEKDRLKAELGNIPPLNALKVLNTRAQKKNQ